MLPANIYIYILYVNVLTRRIYLHITFPPTPSLGATWGACHRRPRLGHEGHVVGYRCVFNACKKRQVCGGSKKKNGKPGRWFRSATKNAKPPPESYRRLPYRSAQTVFLVSGIGLKSPCTLKHRVLGVSNSRKDTATALWQ